MRGQLKFVDGKTGDWGFIVPEDGTADLHFVQKDVVCAALTRADAGADGEFELERNEREEHLTKLATAIEAEVQTMRSIKRRLEDAKLLEEKCTKWNYKTAIPQ